MTFTLEWPTSDVRIQSGTEVSLYGYVQDGQIGEELKVQIRHLESGQYWRPEGSFGDAQNHLAAVVDSSGHWRLMHTPQASGGYELVVQYNDSQERTNIRSTTFNVIGQTFVDPFARPLEPLDNPSPDLDLTNSEIIEPVDRSQSSLNNSRQVDDALILLPNTSFTLEWPTSDVRIQSGTEVSLYGYVQDGQIGEELKVQIRHLESGQYWRPDGSFGDAQNHLAAVVDSSGHWRLMHTPQASGGYELVVQYNDSQERTNIRSTTFNVIGQTFVDPFARPLEPLDNPSPDLDLTNSEIIEPVDEQLLQNTETQKQALIQDQNRSASRSENERLNDTNSTKHNKTLKELGSEETLMIIGQTFQQEYQDFITGTDITPAGSSHYATFYLGMIEQGDDTPNLRFLDYVADNNLGDYALVALSLKDNTMAGGYGQMTNNEQSNFNPNAVHDALLDITNGKWDNQIDQFANSMANRPETHFLVRIGYEVSLLIFGYQGEEYVVDWLNEKSSSGINVFDDPSQVEEINPTTYINAYNYVAERIGSKASNVEFGYHPVRGYSDTKFLYPGQENVDWVGFSVFNNDVGMEVNGTFNANGATIDPNLAKSIEFARDNGHEIVIAEAAAQYPATSNPDQFIKYLDRLDDLIINYDVKALSYINSNWPSKGWGPEWGDSRIEEEAQVKDYFLSTFGNNTRYLGMDDLDKELSFNLMATPTEISNPLTV